MKTITKILLIIVILIIIIIGAIVFLNSNLTGNIIKEQTFNDTSNVHMYTKAICNETNFCQDAEIVCEGNETVSVTPITGAVIQHENDWQDPRPEQDKDKLC
jgi:hypothetical protein